MNMRFLIMIYCLTLINIGASQTNTFSFCNSDFKDNQSQKKIFLLGEKHFQTGNHKIMITYHKFLRKEGVIPKYIIEEDGPSFGYVVNKYFRTGDEYILNMISYDGTTRAIYKDYRDYFVSLPDSEKFRVVGVDIERFFDVTYYAVRDILIKNSSNTIYMCNDSIESIDAGKYDFCEMLRFFDLFSDPLSTSRKTLKKGLDKALNVYMGNDSVFFRDYLLGDYNEFSSIMESYKMSKERKKIVIYFEKDKFFERREKLMTRNVYEIFENDSNAIVFGQFGSDHVMLNNYKNSRKPQNKIRIANVLNNNPDYSLTYHKVSSSIIYYQKFEPKYYKCLNIDPQSIKSKFALMENCDLLIEEMQNKSSITNLILFKN